MVRKDKEVRIRKEGEKDGWEEGLWQLKTISWSMRSGEVESELNRAFQDYIKVRRKTWRRAHSCLSIPYYFVRLQSSWLEASVAVIMTCDRRNITVNACECVYCLSGVSRSYGALGRMAEFLRSLRIQRELWKQKKKNLSNGFANGKKFSLTPFGAPTCQAPWAAAHPWLSHSVLIKVFAKHSQALRDIHLDGSWYIITYVETHLSILNTFLRKLGMSTSSTQFQSLKSLWDSFICQSSQVGVYTGKTFAIHLHDDAVHACTHPYVSVRFGMGGVSAPVRVQRLNRTISQRQTELLAFSSSKRIDFNAMA